MIEFLLFVMTVLFFLYLFFVEIQPFLMHIKNIFGQYKKRILGENGKSTRIVSEKIDQ